MSLLKKIGALFAGSQDKGNGGYYFYVECDRCGEKLRIRADKHSDLSPNYEGGGFTLNKEIMDGRCFQLMYATIEFDSGYHVVSREIEGGRFITREEYEEGRDETAG